jgi:hypothetical protein
MDACRRNYSMTRNSVVKSIVHGVILIVCCAATVGAVAAYARLHTNERLSVGAIDDVRNP